MRSIVLGEDFRPPIDEAGARPTIRATVLTHLCASSDARKLVTARGIRLFNASICGGLDLQYVDCGFPLIFERCAFDTKIDLSFARVPTLRLFDCELLALEAAQLQVNGSVILSKSVFRGAVYLQGMRVGGDVRLVNSRVLSGAEIAINLEGAHIQGIVQFKGPDFRADGMLRLFGISTRAVECMGTVVARTGIALMLEQATVSGSVLLRAPFRALGRVRIFETTIGGSLDLQGAHLNARTEPALIVAGATIGRSLLLHQDHHHRPGKPLRSVRGIAIHRSVVGEHLDIREATIKARRGTALSVVDTVVKGRLIANGLEALGRVVLNRANVANDIEFARVTVGSDEGNAIHGFGVECRGNLFLSDSRVRGPIHLPHVNVANDLVANNLAMDINNSGAAIRLDHAKFGGNLLMRDLRVKGVVYSTSLSAKGGIDFRGSEASGLDLRYATIGLDLLVGRAKLESTTQSSALLLAFAKVQGSIFADEALSCLGGMNVSNCTVGGTIYLRDAVLNGIGNAALRADFLKVGNNLAMVSSRITKEVLLDKAAIEGSLDLTKTQINTNGGTALSAIGVTIRGDLRLGNGFNSNGLVRFDRANIFGDAFFADCKIACASNALSMQAVTLTGDFFAGFTYTLGCEWLGASFSGSVDLSRATIAGDVDLSQATFDKGEDELALRMNRARVGGTLLMVDQFRATGDVDLRNAQIASVHQDHLELPEASTMILDGLQYDVLHPLEVDQRLNWIAAHNAATATPSWQPYEQLAKTLKLQGVERSARRAMMAKERAIADATPDRGSRWLLRLFGWSMGYGYKPQRALYAAPVLIAIMAAVFLTGGQQLMVPVNDLARKQMAEKETLPEGYPPFSSIVYPIDVLLPIVSLQQKDFWRPNARATCSRGPANCGSLLRIALWFYVAAGWIITTLAVAGFTGLIRRS